MRFGLIPNLIFYIHKYAYKLDLVAEYYITWAFNIYYFDI